MKSGRAACRPIERERKSLECAISFVNDTNVSQVMLASEADFNQLVKYESDSDCIPIDVDSTDYDLEELVNGKPVITHRLRSGRQVKAWIRFNVQAVAKR